MPIYEYYCRNCEKIFELMRPITEANDTARCPDCGAECEKLVSAFASKADFYIRPPRKEAFRKLPVKEEKKEGS